MDLKNVFNRERSIIKEQKIIMERRHGHDSERHVVRNESWDKFVKYMENLHPDLNIDVALKPISLKRDPVISYGIIEFTICKDAEGNQNAYYHLFRRRNTVEYEILIRGFAQKNQLYNLISLLSLDERERILNHSWEELWDDLWVDHNYPSYISLKAQSQRKFPEIKELVKLLDDTLECKIPTRPYIFPKGKAEKGETGWQTALREGNEETKHAYRNGSLEFNSPLVQHYIGSDNSPYTDYYYIWRSDRLYSSPITNLNAEESLNSPREAKQLSPKAKVLKSSSNNALLDPQCELTNSKRLRHESISSELESDIWLEIPIFNTVAARLEWVNSVDPFLEFGVFKRHFAAIMEVHAHLS